MEIIKKKKMMKANHKTIIKLLTGLLLILSFNGILWSQGSYDIVDSWQIQNHTPDTHLVLIPNEVIRNMELQPGDFLGAFTTEGQCYGTIEINSTNENHCLTVYGDDVYTPAKDGFIEGEPIQVKLFQTKSSEEGDVSVSFDPTFPNQGFFSPHGISALKAGQLAIGSQEDGSELEFSIFPNPAREEVTITWNNPLPGQATLLFTNAFGQTGKILNPGFFQSGIQQLTLDVSDVPSGSYSVTLKTGSRTGFKRLIIIH